MKDLNSIIISGGLTRDPELSYLTSGTAVCKLNIASNDSYTVNGERKESVCFVEVTAWGKLGESCSEYLGTGQRITVQGKLQSQSWEKDGKKKSKHVIVASDVIFGAKPKEKNNRDNEEMPF